MRTPWASITSQDVAGPFELQYLQMAAALCSLPFIPFSVLRTVRQFVCPDVSERGFCDSDLVEGMSADGVSLDLNFCGPLRAHVRRLYAEAENTDQHAAVDTLRAILDAHSRVLSPLLAVEERLLWTWLTSFNDEAFRRTCDLQLRDVIGTAIFENRQKIYRWASAASQRLPIQCFESEFGWILGQLCRARHIPFPVISLFDNVFSDRMLNGVLTAGLPDRLLGLSRNGEYLELGSVTTRRHVAIAVVDTDPIAIDITAVQQNRSTQVRLPQNRAVRIPVGRETVTIRDLRGRTYTLPEFIGDEAPETAEARTALENAMACHASGEAVRFNVLRLGKKGYVVSLPDLGCTAFLAEPAATLYPGDDGFARVVGIITQQRRVMVRFPRPNIAVRRIDRSAIISAVPPRFPAKVLKLGKKTKLGRRSVHIQLPDDHPFQSSGPDGAGRIRFGNAAYLTDDGWQPVPGSWVDVVVLSEDHTRIVFGLEFKPTGHPITLSPSAREPYRGSVKVGQQFELTVSSVVNFGVFLTLPDGRDGLLHISEMRPPQQKGERPYRPGDRLTVRVARIDAEQGRISLTQILE
jgi:S1 RNA binding domain